MTVAALIAKLSELPADSEVDIQASVWEGGGEDDYSGFEVDHTLSNIYSIRPTGKTTVTLMVS